VGLALLIGGFVWWQGKQRWEATDNAFVQADTTEVSPQIDGYVTRCWSADNQRVEPGQILIRWMTPTPRPAWPRPRPIWPR
jgi:membrane fusion protein (multidrug efflux system)